MVPYSLLLSYSNAEVRNQSKENALKYKMIHSRVTLIKNEDSKYRRWNFVMKITGNASNFFFTIFFAKIV